MAVMVSMHVSSAVDREFEPRSNHSKDYEIGICCFSTKHAALWRKSKEWLVQNRDNVSEWSDMSTFELLFQCTIKNKTKHVGQVQSRHPYHLIECN
jgi:hypothetical protein